MPVLEWMTDVVWGKPLARARMVSATGWTGAVLALLAGAAHAEEAPYAGFEAREIASLSAEDQRAILSGEGWGLALPAELNGYPGPLHVLELSAELALTEAQQAAVAAVFSSMRADAQEAGEAYVAAEAHLSRMFAAGHADLPRLGGLLQASADALTRLREVHLGAHLEVTPILTPEQRATYAQLRGYGTGAADHSGHGGHAHGDHKGHGSN